MQARLAREHDHRVCLLQKMQPLVLNDNNGLASLDDLAGRQLYFGDLTADRSKDGVLHLHGLDVAEHVSLAHVQPTSRRRGDLPVMGTSTFSCGTFPLLIVFLSPRRIYPSCL